MHDTVAHILLPTILLSAAACHRPVLPGGYRLDRPLTTVPGPAALPDPASGSEPVSDADLRDLDLAGCLELALRRNRSLRRIDLDCRRLAAARVAAWRSLIAPRLNADYTLSDTVDDGEHTAAGGGGTVSVPLRYAGFTLEPSLGLTYRHEDFRSSLTPAEVIAADDLVAAAGLLADRREQRRDNYGTSLGLALSRRLFRLQDHVAQKLPLTRSARDLAVVRNRQALELRDLRLAVTRSYFDIHRLRRRLQIRRNRVDDAEAFLATVTAKVANGFAAPVQITNAEISLRQAEANLLAEETALEERIESLLGLLGLDLDRQLELRAETVPEWVDLPVDPAADIRVVRSSHERVRNHLLDMEILRREYLVATDETRPDLTAKLDLSEVRQADGFFAGEDERRAELTFTLTSPLDGFLGERADALGRRLRLQQMALQLAELRDELEGQLRRHYRRIRQWRRTVGLQDARVTAERSKLDATLKRYEAGDIDNLEVTRAKESLEQAELALLQARIEQVLAVVSYHAMLPPAEDVDAVR